MNKLKLVLRSVQKICVFNIRDVSKRFLTTGIITFRAFRPKVLKLENTWARYVQFGELIVCVMDSIGSYQMVNIHCAFPLYPLGFQSSS